jgi:hypothetical protein
MSDKTEQKAAGKVLLSITLTAIFTTVEILAALRLDGWLSVALWAIAIWNVVRTLVLIIGLAVLADQAVKAGESR